MYSLIFFALAAFFDAVMDTDQFHYSKSIFTKYNPKFWDRNISWQGKKFLGIVVLDAWHIAKYFRLGSFIGAIITTKLDLPWYLLVFIYSLIWFIVFESFWSKILLSKK